MTTGITVYRLLGTAGTVYRSIGYREQGVEGTDCRAQRDTEYRGVHVTAGTGHKGVEGTGHRGHRPQGTTVHNSFL